MVRQEHTSSIWLETLRYCGNYVSVPSLQRGDKFFSNVLGLVGRVYFPSSLLVLCLRFITNTDNTLMFYLLLSSVFSVSRPSLLLDLTPSSPIIVWGDAQLVGEDKTRQMTLNNQGDIPCHKVLYLTRREKKGMVMLVSYFLFQKWIGIDQSMWDNESIVYFLCLLPLTHHYLNFLINYSF